MKIQHIALRLALIAAGCAALNGCLSSTPVWDRTFGNSMHTVTSMQTLNPNASANEDPVAGVDGTAATAAQQNYGKSFMVPPPPTNMLTIGIGGSGSSGN
ncbi:hypothetical protein C0Z18_06325 [Trinickia dabaoshanensis]|uniref:Lipoprotein n=1 Tax=Trinickia dabaoshanensis TaxID=564714 RepID=A0A2N7VY97_9BURK|nr:hypothetical protein [Trinickia dabaoshanensis]PMS22121.1 hypothetical protein C0Z18_06325 [Trinickia dabaoshanensis]